MTGNRGKTKIGKVVDMPAGNWTGEWTGRDIQTRTGACNVLVVAPHGYPKDDTNTGKVARWLADELNCYAIVNETYRKPPKVNKESEKRHPPDKKEKWVDLNRFDQVKKHLKAEFLQPLDNLAKECIAQHGSMLAIWIHGIEDKNLSKAVSSKNFDSVHMVIGIGQGKGEDRLTAKKETVDRLIELLKKNPGRPINATMAKRGSRYCGWADKNMAQFFRKEYGHDKVQSIQLEIRRNKFRRKGKQIAFTAEALAKVIRALDLFQVDKEGAEIIRLKTEPSKINKRAKAHAEPTASRQDKILVRKALKRLRELYCGNYHKVMLDVGNYLIKKFYSGHFAYPRDNTKVKGAAWNLFIDQLKDENRTGHLPSKSWVYNAIRLAVDQHHFKTNQTYSRLGHSQKVLLTHIKDADKKRKFLSEPKIHQLTVIEFKDKLNEFLGRKSEISVDEIRYKQDLIDLETDELIGLKKKAIQEIETYQAKLEHRRKVLGLIAEALETQGVGVERKGVKNFTVDYPEFSVDVPEVGYEAGEI